MRTSYVGISILVVLGCFSGFGSAQTQSAPKPKPEAATKAESQPEESTEAEQCVICHQDEVKGFPGNPHTVLALEHNAKGVTCENCHGPGKAHIDSGGEPSKIFQFTKASPKQVDEKCLSCHVGDHPNFERTAHGDAGVGCTSCHSVHHFDPQTELLKAQQPKVCYQCHTDARSAFELPFHHRVNEGLIKCTDCHDPHGTFQDELLKRSADQNAVCTKCHAETAGPFVYEHPPLKLEGCISCHFPHGSPNNRLLTRNNVNSMCLQCHTASMNFTAPGTPSFHNQANQYQACTVCHAQIHGSNADAFFFK